MVKEKLIKQTMLVFTEIQKRLVNPTFKFSQGGATFTTLSNFINSFEKEFGTITSERLVDFCIYVSHAYRNTDKWSIKQAFGPTAIKKFKTAAVGKVYYENLWLSSANLTRENLVDMIKDRQEHPQAKYIYVEAEESSKKRLLNKEVGYMLCQASTLGWSPVSEACQQCTFTTQCKHETQRKYPELYRIRIEYGQTNR